MNYPVANHGVSFYEFLKKSSCLSPSVGLPCLEVLPKEEVIPPGQPFNNGYIESYQGTMREELLDREEFETLHEAQQKITEWVRLYNNKGPILPLDTELPWMSGMSTTTSDITGVSKMGCGTAKSLITPVSLLGAYHLLPANLF
jgi:transposase InsO family protein